MFNNVLCNEEHSLSNFWKDYKSNKSKLYKLPVGEKFGIISNDLNTPPPPLNKKIHYFNHYINLSKIYFV